MSLPSNMTAIADTHKDMIKIQVLLVGQPLPLPPLRTPCRRPLQLPPLKITPRTCKMRLLNLPLEIRFHIFSHLVPPNTSSYTTPEYRWRSIYNLNDGDFSQQVYTYLFRSPSRVCRPHIAGAHLVVLAVCHQLRSEMLMYHLANKTFVLEASLYQTRISGLEPIPSTGFPDSWLSHIRKLLILTVVDAPRRTGGTGGKRPIANLRWLQQMTGLQELRIVFQVPSILGRPERSLAAIDTIGPLDESVTCAWPAIEAVLQCVPQSCRVVLGSDMDTELSLVAHFGPTINYLFTRMDLLIPIVDAVRQVAVSPIQGRLLGDMNDHSKCGYGVCVSGNHCVNSKVQIGPVALEDRWFRKWMSEKR